MRHHHHPLLVLLDRDGVINADVGPPGVLDPKRLALITHAGRAVGRLKRAGCKVVVVTNQSSVGQGLMDLDMLEQIHVHLRAMLQQEDSDAVLDDIYYCTSTKVTADPRRKPEPGMVLEARDAFQFVDGRDCVLVGDRVSDLEAARRGGVATRILVSTGYGESIMGRKPGLHPLSVSVVPEDSQVPESILPFTYVDNLDGAVDFVLSTVAKAS